MGYWIGMSVNWGDLRLLEDNSFWNQQDLQNPKMRGFSWNCEGERELQGKKRLCFSPGVSSVCDPGQPSLCRKSSSCLQRMGLHRSPRAEALFANRRVSDTYPIVYVCHSSFIKSSVGGCLGCFHILDIVNSAEVNIRVHVSCQIIIFSRYMPRSGIVGSEGGSIFSLNRASGFFILSHLP